nr:hypothetical protein [Propionibacterium sp.]
MATYAREVHIPEENAVVALGNQGNFADMVASWSERPDDPVVHAEWRGEEGGRVAVKASLSREARDFASRATFTVIVDVDSSGRLGIKARERATETIGKHLTRAGIEEYALGLDPVSNVLTITVPEASSRSAGELTKMGSEAAVAAVGQPLGVNVEITSNPPVPTHRGGQTYLLGGGPGYCTGGFSVTNSGLAGISTAAHCSPKPSYYDGAVVGETVGGADRDVRWTKVYGAKDARFQYTTGGYYTVNTSRNPTIGEGIGRYGARTGANSATVQLSGQCLKYSGWPQYCGLFATGSQTLQPGDSGGPWYVRVPGPQTVALGISSGYYNGRDYFSGVGSLNLLNMVVVTA